MWTQAWGFGWEAAAEAAGIESQIDKQRLYNILRQWGRAWATQIAQTTLKILAGILAAGGVITLAIVMAALQDLDRWRNIAQTEISRGMSEAASALYRALGIHYVRWLTEPGACPLCLADEAAGRWPLGVPFPSGAIAPPQHPNCRCALVPA